MANFFQTYLAQIIVIGFTVGVIVVFGIMINRSAKKHDKEKHDKKKRKYQR